MEQNVEKPDTADESIDVTKLLHLVHENDLEATNELLTAIADRVDRIARATLRRKFPSVAIFEQTDDIAQQIKIQLLKAAKDKKFSNRDEFFGAAGLIARWQLLNLKKHHRLRIQRENPIDHLHELGAPVDGDIADEFLLDEFHQYVDTLPKSERLLIDMHFYCSISLRQIALLQNVPYNDVQRKWTRLRIKIGQYLKDKGGVGSKIISSSRVPRQDWT